MLKCPPLARNTRGDVCDTHLLRHCFTLSHARHKLLHFINVINFRHFSQNAVVSRVQIWTVMSHRSDKMKTSVSHNLIPEGYLVCLVWNSVLFEDKELVRDLTHDRQLLLSQQHVTAYAPLIFTPRSTNIRSVFHNLQSPMNAISDLLKDERVRSRSFAR